MAKAKASRHFTIKDKEVYYLPSIKQDWQNEDFFVTLE